MPWMLWPFGESISQMKIPAFFFFLSLKGRNLESQVEWWFGPRHSDMGCWHPVQGLNQCTQLSLRKCFKKKKDGKNPTTWAFICFLDTLETEQLAGRLSNTPIEDVGIKSWLDLEWHSAHLINPVSLKTEHLCFIFLLVTSLSFFFVCFSLKKY